MPEQVIKWELAQKICDTCVDISKRVGKYSEDAEGIDHEKSHLLMAVGKVMLGGYPSQVLGCIPEKYDIYAAQVGDAQIGVLKEDIDTWYLRIAGPNTKYYIASRGGEIVLAQVFTKMLTMLDDGTGLAIESWLEGIDA